jgi:hypothetical protein
VIVKFLMFKNLWHEKCYTYRSMPEDTIVVTNPLTSQAEMRFLNSGFGMSLRLKDQTVRTEQPAKLNNGNDTTTQPDVSATNR